MQILSENVERALEATKPRSRPQALNLPKPGDKSSPTAGAESPTAATPSTMVVAANSATTPSAAAATAAIVKHVIPKPATLQGKRWGPMNTDGESVVLTGATFETRVTKSKEPWFIKFYAPWCHHCQALAPKWTQMARSMQKKLNIGEVNCDKEKALCKQLGISAYPSIYFYEDGNRAEYRGLRGLGDFIDFAEKGLDLTTGVQDVDAASFKVLETTDDVIFVYFYDIATTTEDFESVRKLPLHLLGRAKIVTSSDPTLAERFEVTTFPRLMVSRNGRPAYYDPSTPREMRDDTLLLHWMKTTWLPLVPELTAATAREIMEGKLVVLAILDRQQTELFTTAQREVKSAANDWMDREAQDAIADRQKLRDAKQHRIEEAEDRDDQIGVRNAKNIRIDTKRSGKHKEVTFAWVDGVFWQRWLKTTYGVDVRDGMRVIINDEDVCLDKQSVLMVSMPLLTEILEP